MFQTHDDLILVRSGVVPPHKTSVQFWAKYVAQRVGDNKYRVDCSGMFSRTSDCYNVATTTCEGGKFTEINMAIRDQGDVYDAFCDCYVWVISRNLTFKCG